MRQFSGSAPKTQTSPERRVEAKLELSPAPAFEPEQVLAHALEALELRGARRPEGVVGGAAGVCLPVPLLAGSVGGGSLPHGGLDLDPTVAGQVQADRDLDVHPGTCPAVRARCRSLQRDGGLTLQQHRG